MKIKRKKIRKLKKLLNHPLVNNPVSGSIVTAIFSFGALKIAGKVGEKYPAFGKILEEFLDDFQDTISGVQDSVTEEHHRKAG